MKNRTGNPAGRKPRLAVVRQDDLTGAVRAAFADQGRPQSDTAQRTVLLVDKISAQLQPRVPLGDAAGIPNPLFP